ncbi:hypothetical protein B296_00053965, partial [Ensete ventricosum]
IDIASGEYSKEMTLEKLKNFHRRRVEVLAESGADLIAFETIPNKLEAQVVLFDMIAIASTGVTDEDFVSYVRVWCEAGACLIGGCCRTTPNTIRGISKVLQNYVPSESIP